MTTKVKTPGLHHVTAISGDPKRNVAFYTDILGLKMIKKTVNFDDPGTYHLYYGDDTGSPGTALTFFPWVHAAQGKGGAGLTMETAFAVPEGAIAFWRERLAEKGLTVGTIEERFGQKKLSFLDPDGMGLALVETPLAKDITGRAFDAIKADYAIRGFAGVRIVAGAADQTGILLREGLGLMEAGSEGQLTRYLMDGAKLGLFVDIEKPEGGKGQMGRGSVHHVAFRANTDEDEFRLREAVMDLGLDVTDQIDRKYFRSMYFREPSGVIFELATDAPGFAVDEPLDKLGTTLMLPPWLEERRAEIEGKLPPLV